MKKLIIAILVSVFLQPAAFAMKVRSIYEGQVLVSSQNEQQRNQAIQEAFIQTLNKMSGSTTMGENPTIKAALPEAKNQVEEFSYAPSGQDGRPFLLKVQFDAKALKKLLRQAKAPIWDENRPLIMVWVAVDNPGHPAEVIDNQSTQEYALLLKKEALQRGLPIMLPMMDIAELNQISAADIRAKALPLLQKATERYHTDGLLMGNIEPKDKMLTGHWKLVLGQDHWDWDLSSETASGLIALLNEKLVNTLAGRYASVQTEKVSSSFTLVVKGVDQQDDFENMMHFMKHISLIKEMEIENITGDAVIMRLDVQGAQKAFMQEASVGQHLKLQIEKENELTYLWVR
jgi:hypothetical protein